MKRGLLVLLLIIISIGVYAIPAPPAIPSFNSIPPALEEVGSPGGMDAPNFFTNPDLVDGELFQPPGGPGSLASPNTPNGMMGTPSGPDDIIGAPGIPNEDYYNSNLGNEDTGNEDTTGSNQPGYGRPRDTNPGTYRASVNTSGGSTTTSSGGSNTYSGGFPVPQSRPAATRTVAQQKQQPSVGGITPETAEEKSNVLTIILVAVSFFVTLAVVFVVVKLRRVPDDLLNYIKMSLSRGYALDSIKGVLAQQGWGQGMIKRAYKKANRKI